MKRKKRSGGMGDLGGFIMEQLKSQGVDLGALDCGDASGWPVRIACVPANVAQILDEMGKSKRDQVVMVRVDEDTAQGLDAWVETGAVKSRSEAAALFIREGLKVRSSELESLRGALDELEAARTRLRDEARKVFGKDEERELK